MRYRIEISSTKKGAARVHLPGRRLELEAQRELNAAWQVAVGDSLMANSAAVSKTAIVNVRAANANDAVWRVARAAVRALSELTGSPVELDLDQPDPARVASS